MKFCPVCGTSVINMVDPIAHAASHPAVTEEDLRPAFCDQCGKNIQHQPYEHKCNVWADALASAPMPVVPPTI